MKINPCRNCGITNRMVLVRVLKSNKPNKYFVECMNCHSCGKTKLFKRSAINSWNNEQGTDTKVGTKHKKLRLKICSENKCKGRLDTKGTKRYKE